ncbi:MAG: bifunctional diguanylate cyclase/phosphodiesterase [Desulfobacteraceae bacterium]|nr:MAG: bifunctional diguanylate cyclase/phosphodiesterase [Desulfobacteraceae bacterium]
MDRLGQTFKNNVRLMKSRVTKYAVIGVVIAFAAIILATILSSYFQYGAVTLENIARAQKENVTLWVLDAMPFIFAFWGQYSSSIMAYEASSLVLDQTAELRDMTVALEYKAAHEATHDAVTDLPNRVLLIDRTEQAIHAALRQKSVLGLCILNIENFKEVHDTLGHYSGDRLIKQVATRLQGVVRKSDTLARIGTDEFAILLQEVANLQNITGIIDKTKNVFNEPFSVEGLVLDIRTRIGISIFPEHGKDVDTIFQRANLALLAAKQAGKQSVIYSPNLDKNSPHRLTLMGELRQGIENNELVLHYQPKVDLHTRKITGVEALVRWNHPEHGFMPPDEFIPMAERTGMIKPLSEWVLNHALHQCEQWHRSGHKFSIAVNISPTTFLDTELPDLIIGMLSRYDLPSDHLTIEITEGSMIKDPDLAMEILTRLADQGIRISIDDFGTGYSSLAYLKKLPVSEIKIDKSFVTEMLQNENDAVIVKSIIDLGHNLSLNVVAEGVEDQKTASRLKKLGCDVLQGFHFSRPMNNDEFLKRILNQKRLQAAN